MENSAITWTDATYNPWMGCHKVSPGCKNCYMFREMGRYGRNPNVVVRSKTTFYEPLKWKEPKVAFTCSWSDFFIPDADVWRPEVWEIIRATPQHTYLILTKRPELIEGRLPPRWPLPNVWIGVSVENNDHLWRWHMLAYNVEAEKKFVSAEPLLGYIDPGAFFEHPDWIITGGESGPGYRETDMNWVRTLRDWSEENGVMFHHKQNGGKVKVEGSYGGRELDGVTHDARPVALTPPVK